MLIRQHHKEIYEVACEFLCLFFAYTKIILKLFIFQTCMAFKIRFYNDRKLQVGQQAIEKHSNEREGRSRYCDIVSIYNASYWLT